MTATRHNATPDALREQRSAGRDVRTAGPRPGRDVLGAAGDRSAADDRRLPSRELVEELRAMRRWRDRSSGSDARIGEPVHVNRRRPGQPTADAQRDALRKQGSVTRGIGAAGRADVRPAARAGTHTNAGAMDAASPRRSGRRPSRTPTPGGGGRVRTVREGVRTLRGRVRTVAARLRTVPAAAAVEPSNRGVRA